MERRPVRFIKCGQDLCCLHFT